MKTYISSKGISYNKVVNNNYTLGIRTDKITNKLFGIRPNTNDNNNYQFEVSFKNFVSIYKSKIIDNGNLYTRFVNNDNKINLSSNTLLSAKPNIFEHFINIEDVSNELFYAEYIIDYKGYELDLSNIVDIDYSKPYIKGIRVVDYYDNIVSNDYYDYVWLEKNDLEIYFNSTNIELLNYINDNYKYREINKLRYDLLNLSEPIYYNFLLDDNNYDYKCINGSLKFKSNNFVLNRININRPSFYDDEFNKSDIMGEHLVCINNNNQLVYFKIPSYNSILNKMISKSKYLDVTGTLSGTITYNNIQTDDIVSGDLCLLTDDFYTDGNISITDDTIIIGVDNTITYTATHTNYPYVALITDVNIAKLIRDDNDKSEFDTYVSDNGYSVLIYKMIKRKIILNQLETMNQVFGTEIGTSSNPLSCIISYIDFNVGDSENFVYYNSHSGVLCNNIYGSNNNFEFNTVDFNFFCGVKNNIHNIGGVIGYVEYCNFNNCNQNMYGYVSRSAAGIGTVGGSFGKIIYSNIDNYNLSFDGIPGPFLSAVCIFGDNYVSGFIAYCDNSVINDVNIIFSSDKRIYSYGSYTGGFISLIYNSTITNIKMLLNGDLSCRRGFNSLFTNLLNNSSIDNINCKIDADIAFVAGANNGGVFISNCHYSDVDSCYYEVNGNIILSFNNIAYGKNIGHVFYDIKESVVNNVYGNINGNITSGNYGSLFSNNIKDSTITNCAFDMNTYIYYGIDCSLFCNNIINTSNYVIENIYIIIKGTIDFRGGSGALYPDGASNFYTLGSNINNCTFNNFVLYCNADLINIVDNINLYGVFNNTTICNDCLIIYNNTDNISDTVTVNHVTNDKTNLTLNNCYLFTSLSNDSTISITGITVYDLTDNNNFDYMIANFPSLDYNQYPIFIDNGTIYTYIDANTTNNSFYVNDGSTVPGVNVLFSTYNNLISSPVIDTNAGSLDNIVITDAYIYYYITLKNNSYTPKDLITNLVDIRDDIFSNKTIILRMLPNNTASSVIQTEREYIVYNNDIIISSFPQQGIYIPEDNGSIYIQDIDILIEFTSTGTDINTVTLSDLETVYNLGTIVTDFAYSSEQLPNSDLQFEYVFNKNKIDLNNNYWFSNYTDINQGENKVYIHPDNNIYINDDDNNIDDGLIFESIYPLLVPYINDSFMSSFKNNNNGLTYECWIKYNPNGTNVIGNRGWVMSYETGWGPALCLNDDRVALDPINKTRNIGVSPGFYNIGRLQNDEDNIGSIVQNKDEVLHLVGYWSYENNTIKKGVYVNNIEYKQISTPNYPRFNKDHINVLCVGNRGNGDGSHHCKGVKIYSFRLWHTKLSSDNINLLYNNGKYNSTTINYSLTKEIYITNNNSIEINSSNIYENGEVYLVYVSIYTNNTINNYGSIGNKLFIKVIADKQIYEPTIKLTQSLLDSNDDITLTVTGSNNTWVGEVIIDNTFYDGNVTFKIYYHNEDYTFYEYGNSDDNNINTTTDDSSVIISTGVTQLTTIEVFSNNTNLYKAKESDIISFKFKSSKLLKNINVTIDETIIECLYSEEVDNDGDYYWYCSYTIPVVESDYTFSYSINFIDFLDIVGETVYSSDIDNPITIYYLEETSLNKSLGRLKKIDYEEDNIIYNLQIYKNKISPNKIIKNLISLGTFANENNWNTFIKYVPRTNISKYRTERNFKLTNNNETIDVYNDNGFYLPDDSGTIIFFNKKITYTPYNIYIDDKLYFDGDYFKVTIDTDTGEIKYFYLKTGSLEIDEANVFDSSTSGDPHIYPVFGNIYELPNKKSIYRLLQGDNFIFNVSTRFITDLEKNEIKKYYRNINNKEPSRSLITDGVFYDNIFISSDNNILQFNITDDIESDGYYNIFIEDEFITQERNNVSNIVKQIKIQFNHSIYNVITISINFYENPQTKYGFGLNIDYPELLDGLLIHEYLPSTMELNNINDTELLYGFKFKNVKTSIIF